MIHTLVIIILRKEYGLATFLPTILLENVKKKEIRKHLRYYLKKDENEQPNKIVSPRIAFSPKHCASKKPSISDDVLSSSLITDPNDIKLTVRLKYIQLLTRLPTFGGRNFFVTFKQTYVDMVMQVDPCHGLHVKHPGKLHQPAISIDYELIDSLFVSQETDVLKSITIKLKNSNQQGLEFVLDKDDIDTLVLLIAGYIKVLLDREVSVEYNSNIPNEACGAFAHRAPPYKGTHFVYPSGWNYSTEVNAGTEMIVSFANGPPEYEEAIKATNTNFGEESLPPTPNSAKKCNGAAASGSRRSSPFFGDTESVGSDKTTPSKSGAESARSEGSNKGSKSKLLSVKDSLLKQKTNAQKFRDSFRINKKRHSLPNGTPLSSPTPARRRLSSSSDTTTDPDLSMSPNMQECRKELTNMALSNQVLESSTPRGGSPAILQRPILCIKRSSLTPSEHSIRSDKDRLSPLGHYMDTPRKSSFGLNSPDQIPALLNLQESHLATSDSATLD
uniref:FERM domain-containing protein n=1 Tax=Acrobeloides nanus TaxID=290746 RepID=A0A914CS04_9BILA